jgi:hypothetical protein
MTQYGSADFFPQTWAMFRCLCGRLECEHGRHVSELPAGWERIELEDGEIDVCPTCAAAGKAAVAETPL